jgi:hypothetical protein
MFRSISVNPTQALRKSLLIPGLRSFLLLLLASGGLLLFVVATSLALRPEAWRAGRGFLLLAVGVGFATSAGTIVPIVTGGVAFSIGRRLSQGWELLGVSRFDLWLRLWPIWLLCLCLAASSTFIAEPAAWSRVVEVRGVPVAAKVAWERLNAGETISTVDGGWLRMSEDAGLTVRSLALPMTLRSRALEPLPGGEGWQIEGVELEGAEALRGQWKIGTMTLSMRSGVFERYRASSTSPWAMSLGQLRAARLTSPRADRVWYRRWLQLVSVPLFAWTMWSVGTRPVRRRRLRLGRASLAVATVLLFFGSLRLAELLSQPIAVLGLPVGVLVACSWWTRSR